MNILWGVVLLVFGLIAWGGQVLSWLSPSTAQRLSLTEVPEAVEPVYAADIRGEALWDAFTLWTLAAAGLLLLAGSPTWGYFGLLGGGIYVYFGGRGIATRRVMQHRGYRIGTAENVGVGYTFLAIWGVLGLITVVASIAALTPT